MSSKPQYVEAAKSSRQQSRRSVEEILQTDLENLYRSSYPSENCLEPDEIESLVEQGIEVFGERREHLRACHFCAALVDALQPSERYDEELVADLCHVASIAAPISEDTPTGELATLLAARLTAIEALRAALDIASKVAVVSSGSLLRRLFHCFVRFSSTPEMAVIYRSATRSLLLTLRTPRVLEASQMPHVEKAMELVASNAPPESRHELAVAYAAAKDSLPTERRDDRDRRYDRVAAAG